MWSRFSLKDLESHHPMSSSFQFGITMAIVVGIFALVAKNYWVLAVPALLLGVSFLRPSLLDFFNRLWYIFGLFLGWLMSPLFLALFYYFIFTPMVLVIKIFGHKAFPKKGWVAKTKDCDFSRNF